MAKKVPKKLQAVLWSVDVDHLNLEKDKVYIIHQVLIYGSIDEILWLFKMYSKETIREVFLIPYKNYPKETYYFTKNVLLNLKDKHLTEADYVTSISGPVEPRAARSI